MAEEVVIRTVLDLSESAQKTQKQIETALRAAETKQLAHQRRLEAIHLQSGARLQQIEARRQAQIDLIRERALQKEIARQRELERAVTSSRGALVAATAAFTAFAAAGLAAGAAVKRFAELSIQAAIDVNKQVNVLKALTGSADAAEKRFAALFAIAQKTPGLTTSLAATLDAQLRVFSVAEKTIDRLLPVIGRLNAISPLGDPRQFVNNFTQLISQNFERQDLKELVGQSPIAGLLIKEIFNVDNPTNAEAIRAAAKRLGITTVERLAEEFADAAATNSALRNATESFAGQFEKLQDRITVALAPVGEEILKTLLPAFKEFVNVLERDLPKITALLRDNREEFAALAGMVVGVANAVVILVGALSQLDAKLGIVRAVARLAAFTANPQLATTLDKIFSAADQEEALRNALNPVQRRATGNPALAPSNAELRAFATGNADLSLLASLPAVTPTGGGGGGGIRLGGGRSGAASAAQRERDREIKDLIRKQAQSLEERREQELKDFDDLNRLLQVGLVEEESRLRGVAGRPAQLAAFGAATRDRIAAIEARDAELARNTAEKAAKDLAKLPPILSDSERFMQGFADATLSAGDAFEQFGNDVARAFGNVRDLFGSLKRAVLDFFNNLVGSALQNLVRGTLGSLFNGLGGGIGGGLGNLFRTPSFAQAFGGGGISAPPSISSGISSFFGGGGSSGGSGFGRLNLDPVSARQFGGGGGFFSGLGSSLAGAAPLLGLTFGSLLGGQSRAGQALGAAGGLASVAGFLALGGPIGALIGAPLLIGSFFLGRAKQRRADEEASGQMLLQAQQQIRDLAQAVGANQIDASQARGIFESQILAQFISGISGLKTKSVRESRLNNQVRDLRKFFDDVVGPAIITQQQVRQNTVTHSKLIPEFATGGTTRGGLAFLHPGEKVLNLQQQAAVIGQSNPRVFDLAGVPGVRHGVNAFDTGGTFGGGSVPIELSITLVMGKQDQTRAVVTGSNTPQGRAAIVKSINVAKTNREL